MIGTTYMTEAPHVHAHYLTNDTMLEEDGYADMELCCHGCRSTVMYRYSNRAIREFEEAVRMGEGDPAVGHPTVRRIRDEFLARHMDCMPPAESQMYRNWCPKNGRLVDFVDLREEGL